MRPVIGVIPLYDDEKDSVWMVPGYLTGIEEAGGLPLILPFTDDREELLQAASVCDGFLFTGGHDVDPSVYGEAKKEICGKACPVRDVMEREIFSYALKLDKPVLGICRGIQMINALLGGTLYQDLPTEYESETEHHMDPPYDRTAHMVEIVPGSLFAKWFAECKLPVNSYHHQAVKEPGRGLQVCARSEDGLVEAVCMPEWRFVVAVQWHPEFNYKTETSSRILFEKFIKKC